MIINLLRKYAPKDKLDIINIFHMDTKLRNSWKIIFLIGVLNNSDFGGVSIS